MGEAAEMVLEGLMCEACGQWMGDDEAPGYPRRCGGCGGEEAQDLEIPQRPAGSFVCTICMGLPKKERRKFRFKNHYGLKQHLESGAHRHPCPECSKVCTTAPALAAHRTMKHGETGTP